MRFVDASALVKRYVREPGSTRVRSLLRSDTVAVSRLSGVEVVSAFARLTREGALSVATRDRLIRAFNTDLLAWHSVELTPALMDLGQQLLVRQVLRAGHAIQLSAALMLQRALGAGLRSFVVADSRLAAAARGEGLVTELV